MSEADRLFEELGYKKTSRFDFVETFEKECVIGKGKYCEGILFMSGKEFMSIRNKSILSRQELKAINKKCEELGWIE